MARVDDGQMAASDDRGRALSLEGLEAWRVALAAWWPPPSSPPALPSRPFNRWPSCSAPSLRGRWRECGSGPTPPSSRCPTQSSPKAWPPRNGLLWPSRPRSSTISTCWYSAEQPRGMHASSRSPTTTAATRTRASGRALPALRRAGGARSVAAVRAVRPRGGRRPGAAGAARATACGQAATQSAVRSRAVPGGSPARLRRLPPLRSGARGPAGGHHAGPPDPDQRGRPLCAAAAAAGRSARTTGAGRGGGQRRAVPAPRPICL